MSLLGAELNVVNGVDGSRRTFRHGATVHMTAGTWFEVNTGSWELRECATESGEGGRQICTGFGLSRLPDVLAYCEPDQGPFKFVLCPGNFTVVVKPFEIQLAADDESGIHPSWQSMDPTTDMFVFNAMRVVNIRIKKLVVPLRFRRKTSNTAFLLPSDTTIIPTINMITMHQDPITPTRYSKFVPEDPSNLAFEHANVHWSRSMVNLSDDAICTVRFTTTSFQRKETGSVFQIEFGVGDAVSALVHPLHSAYFVVNTYSARHPFDIGTSFQRLVDAFDKADVELRRGPKSKSAVLKDITNQPCSEESPCGAEEIPCGPLSPEQFLHLGAPVQQLARIADDATMTAICMASYAAHMHERSPAEIEALRAAAAIRISQAKEARRLAAAEKPDMDEE